VRHLRKYSRRVITVVTATGADITTFDGRLDQARKAGIWLSDVHLLAEHDPNTSQPVDGRLWLPTNQIISIQIREG